MQVMPRPLTCLEVSSVIEYSRVLLGEEMIHRETRETIKAYLGGYIQGLTEQRCPEFRLTPMGEARAIYRSFEECACLIALQTYAVAERGYRASGRMPAAAAAKIEEIVTHINEGQTPNFPALIAEVLEGSDATRIEQCLQNEMLLGVDFWTLVGGEGTYEELLEIYRELGREKGKAMIDALAFGF
jgi:hypothetical protein